MFEQPKIDNSAVIAAAREYARQERERREARSREIIAARPAKIDNKAMFAATLVARKG